MIAWVYGSGFPKSHNGEWGGTALKPALEPITMARKPLIGTVAENVLAHGTGALNIDGARVHSHDSAGYAYTVQRMAPGADQNKTGKTHQQGVEFRGQTKDGRWPANLIHDGSEEVLAAFPDAPGQMADASTNADQRKTQNCYGAMRRGRGDEPSAESENSGAVGFKMKPGARRLDAGSAARFFYCAKANREDRNEGVGGTAYPAVRSGSTMGDRERADWPARNGNHHPTVKPTDLMAYLCRLVTPAGGTVLDPFMGSGSTGKAAVLEGFRFIGIEREAEYLEIASARIAFAARQPQQRSLLEAA
jgi:site-specific DNA-methyltransferase (adenine-specific)